MLEVCVQQTRRVLGVNSFFRSTVSRMGFVFEADGIHHFTVRFFQDASWTHGARFASWSSFERMISESGAKLRAIDKLRNSWVVEGPSTTSDGEALMYFAAASMPRSYALVDFCETGYVAPSWTFVVDRYEEMPLMTEART